MVELELTYLAKRLPKEIESVLPTRIMDIYIPEKVEHAHLRLRQKGDSYEMTKKVPISQDDFSEQNESTIKLEADEFLALVGCSNKKVEKNRYKVEIDGRMAEVDVFMGKLEGLVMVDYEFDAAEEKAAFRMPDFALAEVTQEEFVAGGYLAGRSYDDIAEKLEKFGYKKLISPQKDN